MFEVESKAASYAQFNERSCFDYETEGECGGQLVRCVNGELELFGHAGEWIIPADHMVYIPADRMFRICAHIPSSLIIIKFSRGEVPWQHDGCWVGEVDKFAEQMISYALKWGFGTSLNDEIGRSFFVTLGQMLPEWFTHERIMWTPYAQNSTIQRVIDFARENGPSIGLADAASHACVSERTLRRHMQSELGQSWREFIRELRMNKAMELLRRERRSITQVAFEVGFSSSSAFSSAFTDYVGKTPSTYAKSATGQLL